MNDEGFHNKLSDDVIYNFPEEVINFMENEFCKKGDT